MNASFSVVMILVMATVTSAMVWLVKRSVQPPTAAGKKRQAIFLRFIVAQSVILTSIVLLSVQHLIPPRFLAILGIANFVGSALILTAAFKRVPISDQDVSQEQRRRAIKASNILLVIYVIGLINGLGHVRQMPLPSILVGIAVNVLILFALGANIRRNKAKLEAFAEPPTIVDK